MEDKKKTLWERVGTWVSQHGIGASKWIGMLLCVILAFTASSGALRAAAWSMYGCMFSCDWLMGSLAAGGKRNRTTALLSGCILLACFGYFIYNLRFL